MAVKKCRRHVEQQKSKSGLVFQIHLEGIQKSHDQRYMKIDLHIIKNNEHCCPKKIEQI